MWSSVTSINPIHQSSMLAPAGSSIVAEPQVDTIVQAYRPVQPPSAPYEILHNVYTRRLWVC
jgi:hypothetical protein